MHNLEAIVELAKSGMTYEQITDLLSRTSQEDPEPEPKPEPDKPAPNEDEPKPEPKEPEPEPEPDYKKMYEESQKALQAAQKANRAKQETQDQPKSADNQYERAQVVKAGIDTKTKVNADCSSLVRACCKYCGFDPGNFYTADEVEILYKTGQFLPVKMLADKSELYRGDILVTNGRGHTVIVTRGPVRPVVTYFEKYEGPDTCSIVDALHYIGARYTKAYRALIAEANGIEDYTGTAAQNGKMLALLKVGELIKP